MVEQPTLKGLKIRPEAWRVKDNIQPLPGLFRVSTTVIRRLRATRLPTAIHMCPLRGPKGTDTSRV